jgi:hypothetical protein
MTGLVPGAALLGRGGVRSFAWHLGQLTTLPSCSSGTGNCVWQLGQRNVEGIVHSLFPARRDRPADASLAQGIP